MLIVKKEKNHEPPFSFQKLNKYFLMPFFVPIICFTTKFFSEAMKLNDREIDIKDVTEDNTHTFVFMYQIIQSICLILGGLSYFMCAHRSKIKKKPMVLIVLIWRQKGLYLTIIGMVQMVKNIKELLKKFL